MKIWIYIDGQQQGPYTLEELLDKPVTENTKVWFEGLPKWYPAGYLEEMRPLFDGSLLKAKENVEPVEPQVSEPGEVTEVVEEAHHEAEPTAGYEPEAERETVEVSETVVETEPVSAYAPGRRYIPRSNPEEPCPPTHIGWTVFLTICCCSPVSVAALIASICVSSFYSSGNVAKARKASTVAEWLIMIAIALGLIPCMLMGILIGD